MLHLARPLTPDIYILPSVYSLQITNQHFKSFYFFYIHYSNILFMNKLNKPLLVHVILTEI